MDSAHDDHCIHQNLLRSYHNQLLPIDYYHYFLTPDT